MTVPYRGILFQTQKDKNVIQLVAYAKHLYLRGEGLSRQNEKFLIG
jgi:hypothetical protein